MWKSLNHKEAIEKLIKKWDETGMNVPISWLGNRRNENKTCPIEIDISMLEINSLE